MEPCVKFIKRDLAITVLVELFESFKECFIVEGLVTTNLSVELLSNLSDLFLFEETRVVSIEGGEQFFNDFGKFCGSD